VAYQFDGHLLTILHVDGEVELPEGSATDLLPELELPPDHLLHPGSQTRELSLRPPPTPHRHRSAPDPSHVPQAAPRTDRIAPAPLASIGRNPKATAEPPEPSGGEARPPPQREVNLPPGTQAEPIAGDRPAGERAWGFAGERSGARRFLVWIKLT